MQKAIIGKKIGMTQIFDEHGKVVPVTVIEAWSLRRKPLNPMATTRFR